MSEFDARGEIKKYLERRRLMGGERIFRIKVGHEPRAPRDRRRDEAAIERRRPTGAHGISMNGGVKEPRKRTVVLEDDAGAAAPGPPAAMREKERQPVRIKRLDRGEGVSVKHGGGVSQADLFGVTGGADRAPDLSALDYEALGKRVAGCTLCPLCEGRTKTVFGSGDPNANIIFIGEAPGREEDLQGLPFVGRAGQLLTKILAAVGLTRDEVYITNILKCRPPDNRDPNERETQACKPYLKRQIELIEPVLICALGRIAGQNLLERNTSLSVLRQHVHYYEDVKTVVTYHPAALLRNPNLKRAAWEDIQEVRRIYDETLKDV